MKLSAMRSCALAVAVAAALAPAPGAAIAPVLLVLIKQIAQQVATSMIKDTLLAGLSDMGCKGIALSNALAAFDLRSAAGGVGAIGAIGAMGGMGGMLGGMPSLPAGTMAIPNLPSGAGMALGGLPPGLGLAPDMAAKMGAMLPGAGNLPPGMAPDADQMAMMARLQQSMGQPLSPPETLATIDELFELGFLPQAIRTELKECMVLVPQTIPALGMGMGMLKPMLPQLRQARAEMAALSPPEQDEIVAALLEQARPLPADQRAALVENLDSGFFPPRVAAGVKAGLAGK